MIQKSFLEVVSERKSRSSFFALKSGIYEKIQCHHLLFLFIFVTEFEFFLACNFKLLKIVLECLFVFKF